MALEISRSIADAHDAPISCVAYNHSRRELYTASQDASIKVYPPARPSPPHPSPTPTPFPHT